MSLGLTIISAILGMIIAGGLYYVGQVGLVGGMLTYSFSGVIIAIMVATAALIERTNA